MSFPAALVHQLYWKPPYPTADFTGKTVIVTGANVGLGKEAVKHFVRLNAKRVIATARSLARGQPAKDEIEAETKRDGVVELWELDYSKYASVKAFGARAASLPRIDALVLNASMATRTFEMLEDNESTITVNVISTALLTLLLLPTLQLSATKYGIVPVLTTVSSGTHAFVNFSEHKSTNIFETINNENTANMEERYVHSLPIYLDILGINDVILILSSSIDIHFPNCCRFLQSARWRNARERTSQSSL